MSSIASLVKDARALGRKYPPEHSLHLEDVYDRNLGITVNAWRRGHYEGCPLHSMMPRVGGFPPALARYFIAKYTNVGDMVLDPFCGKGTVLLESIFLGRPCVGGDIGPDAVAVSRAKCAPVSIANVANYIEGLRLGKPPCPEVPEDVAVFFSPETLRQLISVRERILGDIHNRKLRNVATFACGVLLGLLHGHSRLSLSLPCNQVFAMSPNYVRNFAAEHGLVRPDRDVKACLLSKALQLLPGPKRLANAVVVEGQAKRCHRYLGKRAGNVRLVLTSPPYLDRQTYIKDAWLRLWFLKRDRAPLYKETLETGNVITFVEGMKESLASINNCLKPDGVIVLVCGQAHITIKGKKSPLRIGDLCLFAIDKLTKTNLRVENIIFDRKLMKRGSYFAVHHGKNASGDGTSGERYGEDEIIVFRK